jgi:hypothetical protein
VIYFDKDNLLHGIFQDQKQELEGDSAINRLMDGIDKDEFTVNVYKIDQLIISLWAKMTSAAQVHMNWVKDLTHFKEILSKFSSKKSTGFLEISTGDGKTSGFLFFDDGRFIGGSYSWGNGKLDNSKESQNLLIQKALESEGTLRVMKLPSEILKNEREPTASNSGPSAIVINMLEELLILLNLTISKNHKTKFTFDVSLKRKFLEKADKYHFLDPFAGQMSFSDKKLSFAGDSTDRDLAAAILECVTELANELGVYEQFMKNTMSWARKYPKEVSRLDIRFRI